MGLATEGLAGAKGRSRLRRPNLVAKEFPRTQHFLVSGQGLGGQDNRAGPRRAAPEMMSIVQTGAENRVERWSLPQICISGSGSKPWPKTAAPDGRPQKGRPQRWAGKAGRVSIRCLPYRPRAWSNNRWRWAQFWGPVLTRGHATSVGTACLAQAPSLHRPKIVNLKRIHTISARLRTNRKD